MFQIVYMSNIQHIYFFINSHKGRTIWYLGGGAVAPRKKLKKIVSRHKSQKKSLLRMWTGKKFVVEIDEKYVDQKKHQMVTYIIGKTYNKNILRRNIKKEIVGR